MRKWMLSLVCGLLLASAAGLGGGCDEEDWGPSNWEFHNHSSYRVYVGPNGQSWPAAMINPGDWVEVDYNGDSIQYIWNPSDKVSAIRGDGRTIHFNNL